MIVNNILDLIGNTPMVKVNYLNPNPKVELYLKLEKFNPGGSVKDRIAKYMIEQAEKTGKLTKDKIVIEPTSGNTGIGLALVCRVKGYNLTLVMPETM
ncbi:MAG: pyridoxal-phosphate dependent enzyme, partial [Candidatus Bathyarchaeia archaeon]